MNINWFNNIALGKKLVGGFLLASLITALVGGVGFFQISSNMTQVREMVEDDINFLKDAEELEIFALMHRRYEKDFLLNIGKNEKQKEYLSKFKSVSVKAVKIIDNMVLLVKDDPHLSSKVKKAARDAQTSYAKYKSGFLELTKTIMSDETITPQEANSMMKPFKSHIYQFEQSVDVLLKGAIGMVDFVTKGIFDSGKQSRLLIGILLIVGLVFSIALGFILKSLITRPINEAVAFADKMAQGDLTQKINIDQKDEIGTLVQSLNAMSLNLRNMFQEIIQSTRTLTASSTELIEISEQITSNSEATTLKSNTVAAASEEMSANMNSVASATEQTTSNIQMVVSAAEEMTATIQEIAKNTATGNEITQSAVKHAQEVSGKVDELGMAAEEINKVTEAITDISEQTNLLALNATIEAARAGDAGKGFAVVAGEIKLLAQQTAEATTEINSKIAGVQSTTAESVSAIGTIVNVINEINEIVASVATAIEEQSATTLEISHNVGEASVRVGEVNDNINQISAVTSEVTQNVAEVSQAAGETNTGSIHVKESAEGLSELAEHLNEIVNQFKT